MSFHIAVELRQRISPTPAVRVAREADLDRVVEIHAASFPDARTRDQRRRNFSDNARGDLRDLWVAELEDRVVGHAFLFRMQTWVAGRRIPMGGVASVGVAPEARGRGVAKALLRSMYGELRSRGVPLCLLYPFRHRFYRRHGFGMVAEVRRLRIPPGSFPAGPAGLAVTSPGSDGFAAIQRCYERVAARSNGLIGRSDAVWRRVVGLGERQVVVVPAAGGEVNGYLVFHYLVGAEGLHQELDVAELVAETPEVRRALYGFLRAQRDQVPCIRMVVDARDPLLAVLEEPRGPYPHAIRSLIPVAGEVGAGAMLRLVDVRGSLRARGWHTDGVLTVEVRLPDGTQEACTLDVRLGVPEVRDAQPGPRLRTDLGTLAQLYTGYLRPTDAVALGVAEVDAPDTAALADRLFSTGGPYFPLDVF